MTVVYEVEDPAAAHPGGAAPDSGAAAVVRVHAAPAAPGLPGVPGPRTFCGRDTFAMRAAAPQPVGEPRGQSGGRTAGEPGAAWYDEVYADLVCPACDDAVGTG